MIQSEQHQTIFTIHLESYSKTWLNGSSVILPDLCLNLADLSREISHLTSVAPTTPDFVLQNTNQ